MYSRDSPAGVTCFSGQRERTLWVPGKSEEKQEMLMMCFWVPRKLLSSECVMISFNWERDTVDSHLGEKGIGEEMSMFCWPVEHL